MLKQYFTDGLIQIAIVLSLLRTDLNNYLNSNYVNYPEVQEIIQGQTVAYSQANFHQSFHTHLGSPEIYRKNIELDHNTIIRDLRSFRSWFPPVNEVNTFLLIGGGSSSFINQNSTENEQVENEDENNNVEAGPSSLSLDELHLEGQNLLNTLEETIGAIANHAIQGTDPTNEDLDLIDVLWRQDLDLGVGKEMFDPNLRRQMERDREIELQKERQKQKEQEQIQAKLEEQQRNAQQRWLHDNFTQDGETGEWIPLGGSRVAPPPPAPELTNVTPEAVNQFLPSYDSFGMMGDGLPQESNNNYNVIPNHPPPQYPTSQPMQHQQPQQGMYNMNMGQYNPHVMNNSNMNNNGTGNRTGGFRHQLPAQQACNMSQAYHQSQQQNQYNNATNFNHHQHNFSHVQNVSQHQPQVAQPQPQQHHPQQHNDFPRQSSLEATWQDLVNILDLPNSNRTAPQNASLPNQSVAPMPNTSSMLIQNASMPTPAPMGENVTFNNSGLVSQCHRSPPHSSGMLSPCGENFNSSMPSGSGMGSLDWNPCNDLLFSNISQTDSPLDNVDELLPDLITEDELEDINFAEMGLSDGGLTPTPSGGNGDEASSDSAVSMGSQSVGSPDQSDLSDGAMSPFDGLEGATGGHDGFSKTSKYDPDDYKFGNSCSYSSGGDSNCSSNFSSNSNETGCGGHFGNGNGHDGYSPASNGHINHNHTYPLKSGSDPKDIKKHLFNKHRDGKKGPQSKDHKRIEELKIPYSVDQIVETPVEEFNEMLTRNKFSDQQLQLIRDIRRRGKNKVAAQNCRKRKIVVLEHLEDEMDTLEKMRDKLVHERQLMDEQTREMKEKLGLMYSEIFHSLRDEHGRPYDPSLFSLQQSSDGDVFLVPRNYTSEDEMNKKKKSENK